MNKTTHYQLNQWEADDQVRRTDFNEDNAKIDAALEALQTAVATIPKIAMGTYVGTGGQGHSLTLPFEAKILVVIGNASNASSGYFLRGASMGMVNWCGGSVSNLTVSVTWNGRTVSWYTSSELMGLQLDTKGTTYHYLALG